MNDRRDGNDFEQGNPQKSVWPRRPNPSLPQCRLFFGRTTVSPQFPPNICIPRETNKGETNKGTFLINRPS